MRLGGTKYASKTAFMIAREEVISGRPLCRGSAEDVGTQCYCLPLAAIGDGINVSPCTHGLFSCAEESGHLHICSEAETLFQNGHSNVHAHSKSLFTAARQPSFTAFSQS